MKYEENSDHEMGGVQWDAIHLLASYLADSTSKKRLSLSWVFGTGSGKGLIEDITVNWEFRAKCNALCILIYLYSHLLR